MNKKIKGPRRFTDDIIIPEHPNYIPGYGNERSEEGTENHRLWLHLQLYTKTPVIDAYGKVDTHQSVQFQWELEQWESMLHMALTQKLWLHLKDAEGNLFKTFKRYLRYAQPWGMGLGRHYDLIMDMLRTYCPTRTLSGSHGTNHHICVADLIDDEVQKTGAEEVVNLLDLEKVELRSDEHSRAIARAPINIRHLQITGILSKEIAAKFGPYCNQPSPTPHQQERADQAAAAAADIARFIERNPIPPLPGKDLNAYRTRLRGVAIERLSLGQTTVKVSLKSAKTAATMLRKRANRKYLEELITLLQEAK